MTDGNTATYADTEYDGNLSYPLNQNNGFAFAGMTGLGTISSTAPISSISLTFELDLYGAIGGFFGDNGTGDFVTASNGDDLLFVPTDSNYFNVQVTTDGTTWTNAAFTTNYYQMINGFDVGDGATAMVGPTATFTLDNPAANIEGIRVEGEVAGPRDGGILGVAEMTVDAPEPSTYALLGLGMAGLLAIGRFARQSRTA